jgi:threonine/homoserine/homoserine lactone efflux protein
MLYLPTEDWLLLEFFVLLIYSKIGGQATLAGTNPRFERISNRIAGSLLVGAGIGLARLKRT